MDPPIDPPSDPPVVAEAPNLGAFLAPPTLLTPHAWTETKAVSSDTFSRGVWVRNDDGVWALRKPGTSRAGSLEAVREVVCSIIAKWLHVPTPTQELLLDGVLGPCSISYDLPDGQTYRWYNVIDMRLSGSLFADGTLALQAYAGPVVILDALVGAIDRVNRGNHLYVESERRWYTIDYGLSFNRFPNTTGDDGRTGVGDPRVPFGILQDVFPQIITAIGLSPEPFRSILSLAESIPDGRFEELLRLVPPEFARAEDAQRMVAFLSYRRANLRPLLRAWCEKYGMANLLT